MKFSYGTYLGHYYLYEREQLIKLLKSKNKRLRKLFQEVSSYKIKNGLEYKSFHCDEECTGIENKLIAVWISELQALILTYRVELKRLEAMTFWQRMKIRFQQKYFTRAK